VCENAPKKRRVRGTILPPAHSANLPGKVKSMTICVDKANTIRVLFVEDDEDYREIVSDELSEQGFVVEGFADGASLLDSLDAAVEADVILLDWSLPKISGIDLLSQLRQLGVTLPVVFLTGRYLVTYERLAFERGAIDFIDKLPGGDVLVRRLRRAVKAAEPVADPPPSVARVATVARGLSENAGRFVVRAMQS
jgi:DNA-binding response OmpR family regulator